MNSSPWVVGTRAALPIVAELGAEFLEVPDVRFDRSWSTATAIEKWRFSALSGPAMNNVVVAVWPGVPRSSSFADGDLDQWTSTVETPFAQWFASLAVGAERCADGGQMVVVTDRPDPTDSAGWAAEAAVADSVEITVRSLAQLHGDRGVRINLVTTPMRLLASGGSIRSSDLDQVTRTVTMLLSNSAPGMTCAVVHLRAGR